MGSATGLFLVTFCTSPSLQKKVAEVQMRLRFFELQAMLLPPQTALYYIQYFTIFRKTAEQFLRINENVLVFDLENAPAALDKLDRFGHLLFDFGCQPDSPLSVASSPAIGNFKSHLSFLPLSVRQSGNLVPGSHWLVDFNLRPF